MLQLTAVDPGEALVVIHSSKSGDFHYVQTRNYRGWLASRDMAFTTRTTWLNNYVQPSKFLVVIADKLVMNINGQNVLWQMGGKIAFKSKQNNSYNAIIPTREMSGQLKELVKPLQQSASISEGFLPYTRENLIKQSFKFINQPYGWGGLKNSVDCSSFTANIYRSAGIELPRDADQQEQTFGKRINLNKADAVSRAKALLQQKAGDCLFMPGHTMLYLGHHAGDDFAIHSLGSHYNHKSDGSKEKLIVMKVVVSDFSLKRANGKNYADSISSIVSYVK